MANKLSLVARKIAKGGKNIIFTGAGISTESGIPDFRSQGGIWDKYRPVYFDDFMSSREARIEYWERKVAFYPDLMNAKPNPAHMSVAELHEMGLLEAVITQNIDGLHQESGVPDEKVIELHGNTRRARCMSCQKIVSIHQVHKRIEKGDSIVQLFADSPMEDAVQSAIVHLMDWIIEDYGIKPRDLYIMLSVLPDFRINVYQMVRHQSFKSVVGAELPKKYLL